MNFNKLLRELQSGLIKFIQKVKNSKVLLLSLTLLSIAYPILLICLSWDEIIRIKNVNLSFLIISFVLYLTSTIIQSLNWTIILKRPLKKFFEDVLIYSRTLLMQRLPGGFWQWIGRINIYESKTSVSSKTTFTAIFYERITLIASGFVSFLLFNNILLGFAGIIIIWILLSLWKRKDHPHFSDSLFYQSVHIFSYIICWILGGLLLHTIIVSLYPNIIFSVNKSIVIWSITGMLGLVFFFLPGGIGIRELSLSTLLMPELDFSQTILISLSLRILFLSSDLLIGLMGILLSQFLQINV
jgi:hypothetical protein